MSCRRYMWALLVMIASNTWATIVHESCDSTASYSFSPGSFTIAGGVFLKQGDDLVDSLVELFYPNVLEFLNKDNLIDTIARQHVRNIFRALIDIDQSYDQSVRMNLYKDLKTQFIEQVIFNLQKQFFEILTNSFSKSLHQQITKNFGGDFNEEDINNITFLILQKLSEKTSSLMVHKIANRIVEMVESRWESSM